MFNGGAADSVGSFFFTVLTLLLLGSTSLSESFSQSELGLISPFVEYQIPHGLHNFTNSSTPFLPFIENFLHAQDCTHPQFMQNWLSCCVLLVVVVVEFALNAFVLEEEASSSQLL